MNQVEIVNFFPAYGKSGASLPEWVLYNDPFNDNSLDATLWNKTDANAVMSEADGVYKFDVDNNTYNDNAVANDGFRSFFTNAGATIVTQCDVRITDYVGPSDASFFYFGLNRSTETSIGNIGAYFLFGRTDTKNDDEGIRVQIWTAPTTKRYDVDDGSPFVDLSSWVTVKQINTSGHDNSFYYWNGSSWTQIGTTQNWNIRSSQELRVVFKFKRINAGDEQNEFNFRNFYMSSQDYSTQYPE